MGKWYIVQGRNGFYVTPKRFGPVSGPDKLVKEIEATGFLDAHKQKIVYVQELLELKREEEEKIKLINEVVDKILKTP